MEKDSKNLNHDEQLVSADNNEANFNKLNMIQKFLKGFFMPFKTMFMFMFKPRYWHYFAIPLTINIVIYFVVSLLCYFYVFPFIDSLFSEPNPDAWYYFVYRIWNWIAAILTVVIFGFSIAFSFSMLFFIVAAPFADMLAEKIESDVYGLEPPKYTFLTYLKLFAISIYDGLILNLKIFCATAVLFPFSFIPVVGFVPMFIASSYFYGVTFLSFSSEHHQVRHKEFLQKMKENRSLCLGLGLCLYLSNYIPLLPIIVYPAGVIAGTIVFNEYLNPQNSQK
ncbi:EI24 domain-containing protein [Lentisphaerota bacterium WC36G]|nr:EI24 domain-containing protein [Lentisphaerae bacterium WC36]